MVEELIFENVRLEKQEEAELVLAIMRDLLRKYESVTISDLYELVGIDTVYIHSKYGWKDLDDVKVKTEDTNWLVDLPRPIPLD